MEQSQCVDKEIRYTMLLAPFQPMLRIELETYINNAIQCYLDVRNVVDKSLNIIVTKMPVVERQITLSLTELEIQGKSTSTIAIKWSPREAGCWRDIIQLTDSRRIKYDIVVATTAKEIKKISKARRRVQQPSLRKPSDFSMSTTNKGYQQDNASLKIPFVDRSINTNLNTQMKQDKSKYENVKNKENVFSKYNESNTYESQPNEKKIKESHHYEHYKSDILSEQHTNMKNDGSILQQALPSLKTSQEIRRATYIKETRHNKDLFYECNEEITEDTTSANDKSKSEFSILINKFTFASTEITSSSPQLARNESRESMSSPSADKHKTFNVSHSQFFETPTVCKTKDVDVLSVQQSLGMYNLSPIKSDGWSLIPDVKDLIASSPIAHLQQSNILRDTNEHLSQLAVDINPSSELNDHEYFSLKTISRDTQAAKKSNNIYIEISPPSKHFHFKSSSILKLSATKSSKIIKDKTFCEGRNRKKFHVTKKGTRNVPATRINKLCLDALRETKLYTSSVSRESSFRMHNKEDSFAQQDFELDPFAPSTKEDPFLKNTIRYDEEWLLQQELAFIKWLNALLSSPEDLSVDIETTIVDIGKIWQLCKVQKTAVLAETKETVSARYHISTRLNTLRKAARVMFNRTEVTDVLSRTTTCITKGILCIRPDRNLHRDIGLQKLILSLFLSYNPLWLRIGLETVYGQTIPLRSNNDIIGLTRFLLTRFFSHPRLIKMHGYHKTDPSKKFITQLNQFILKKFLFLVYFLDYAKQQKLIGHDPCLFHKRSMYKESREILLNFSREVLSGIGDITRLLRGYNYVLAYRQTFIEEYDYAVINIRRDLRDGVRLCRAMELITGAKGLTQECRTPAISRLQRVYNVNVALNALHIAGYILAGDIDAKSIADGHREKTLSLLWQIIHKYQAPRFDQAARVVQRWWRAQLWYIRIRNYLHMRKNNAAIIIQRAWKHKTVQSWQAVETCDLEERKIFLHARLAAIYLQRWWRHVRESTDKLYELRNKRRIVIALQRRWRATLQMRMQRDQYHNVKTAALTIQRHWRAVQAMKSQRYEYFIRRNAVVRIQSWWRFRKITRDQREWFLRSKESVRTIQAWWRRYLLKKRERNNFLRISIAALTIQRWWRGVIDRKYFLLLRTNVILIQKKWKKYHMHKRRIACLKIQAWWRAAVCLRRYKLQKSCCMKLQCWWRRIALAKYERAEFLRLRDAAMVVQKNWRAKTTRRHYLKQRSAVLLICSWYLHARMRKAFRQHYLKTKNAAIQIQNWWRNIIMARTERRKYLRFRESVLFLQAHWRQRIIARTDRQRYISEKKACIILQSWWRMIRTSTKYKWFKTCVIKVQRRWRALRAARAIRKQYLLTIAVITIQTHWRAYAARKRFFVYRKAAIVIQSYYKMRIAIRRYKTVKYATLIIQSYWRAYITGKCERLHYLSLRQAAISIQRYYRRKKAADSCKKLRQQESFALKVQNEYGEVIQMDPNVTTYLALPENDYWKETISILRSCSSVGMLLTCLNSLDTITRLTPTVCITLCELHLVEEIYNTIAQSNRSLPWMKVCLQTCSILITLAKYSYTRKYIVKKEYALPLVKLLNGTLKEKEVFLHCATLIWLVSHDEDYSKSMANCPQIRWLLRNIQQKILKDSIKFQKWEDLEELFPTREPDSNNTHKPRLFTDMSFAIAAIIKKICT